jgi:hypothetical protein
MRYLVLVLALNALYSNGQLNSFESLDVDFGQIETNRSAENKTSNVVFAIGAQVGQENFFGVKGSILFPYYFSKESSKNKYSRKWSSNKGKFDKPCLYTGLDLSAMGLFAVWFSAGINAGISLKHITLDNNIAFFGLAGPDNQFGNHLTYNPKFGILIGPVWIKAGPSFLLNPSQAEVNPIRLKNQAFNVEFTIILR